MRSGDAHTLDTRGWVQLETDDAVAELLYVRERAAPGRAALTHFAATLRAFARRTFA
jgi:hypothetical protein